MNTAQLDFEAEPVSPERMMEMSFQQNIGRKLYYSCRNEFIECQITILSQVVRSFNIS